MKIKQLFYSCVYKTSCIFIFSLLNENFDMLLLQNIELNGYKHPRQFHDQPDKEYDEHNDQIQLL